MSQVLRTVVRACSICKRAVGQAFSCFISEPFSGSSRHLAVRIVLVLVPRTWYERSSWCLLSSSVFVTRASCHMLRYSDSIKKSRNRAQRVSDVSRSLQSWVSTTHRSYSQLTFNHIAGLVHRHHARYYQWNTGVKNKHAQRTCLNDVPKTSAVSTTDWMVETQLCKLRGTSDTFVGRAYSIFHL